MPIIVLAQRPRAKGQKVAKGRRVVRKIAAPKKKNNATKKLEPPMPSMTIITKAPAVPSPKKRTVIATKPAAMMKHVKGRLELKLLRGYAPNHGGERVHMIKNGALKPRLIPKSVQTASSAKPVVKGRTTNNVVKPAWITGSKTERATFAKLMK